jgi:ribosomal protein L31
VELNRHLPQVGGDAQAKGEGQRDGDSAGPAGPEPGRRQGTSLYRTGPICYNSSFVSVAKEPAVKEGIHPNYQDVEVRCACGNTFKTRSTKPELHLEICSACHPFFTGRQKLIDTEGRVERFNKKFGLQTSEQRKAAEKAAKAAKPTAAKKKTPVTA